jgi:hypothetical protein
MAPRERLPVDGEGYSTSSITSHGSPRDKPFFCLRTVGVEQVRLACVLEIVNVFFTCEDLWACWGLLNLSRQRLTASYQPDAIIVRSCGFRGSVPHPFPP